MGEPALTLWQPHADLVMADDGAGGCLKPVENRGWPAPNTLPQWWRCHKDDHRSRWKHYDLATMKPSGCCVPDGPLPIRLWIHAGKTEDRDYHGWHWDEWRRLDLRRPPVYGALLGSVALTGCHHASECAAIPTQPCRCLCHRLHGSVHVAACCEGGREPDPFGDPVYCSRWAEPDRWHWTLTDPEPLPEPIPMRGRQRLWTVEVPAHA